MIPRQAGMPTPAMDPPPDGPIADGYANPDGTTPSPSPDAKFRPVGYWESKLASLAWSRSATTWASTWSSVVCDLRTDLRGVSSRPLAGTPINRVSALQMWIAVSGLSHNHVGMKVLMSQWGHPVDATRVAQFLPATNVTADLATGLDLTVLDYFPPGSGYQMRYWQVKLQFVFPLQFVPAALPLLQVQAGVY